MTKFNTHTLEVEFNFSLERKKSKQFFRKVKTSTIVFMRKGAVSLENKGLIAP